MIKKPFYTLTTDFIIVLRCSIFSGSIPIVLFGDKTQGVTGVRAYVRGRSWLKYDNGLRRMGRAGRRRYIVGVMDCFGRVRPSADPSAVTVATRKNVFDSSLSASLSPLKPPSSPLSHAIRPYKRARLCKII